VAHQYPPPDERQRHRRQPLRPSTSLLNYETVKYFVAEEREARRYDRSMARYEEASVEAYVSLAVLNAGQATIFTLRPSPALW